MPTINTKPWDWREVFVPFMLGAQARQLRIEYRLEHGEPYPLVLDIGIYGAAGRTRLDAYQPIPAWLSDMVEADITSGGPIALAITAESGWRQAP